MSSDRLQGTVKWFSNKKGYGFIQPGEGCPTSEDIFVHQTAIHSEGFRTLGDGWTVEFTLGKDEAGKVKADNVTAPGGGPCTGPRPPRRPRKQHDDTTGEDGKPRAAGRTRGDGSARQPQPLWHAMLQDVVKESLASKNIRTTTGTIDISVSESRIKLGTRGYASAAHADAILAEGGFNCTENGDTTFEWNHVISFTDAWHPATDEQIAKVPLSLNLSDANVLAVGADETAETLWGSGPTNPLEALTANGFQMRRVVLTAMNRR